jgi:hypothetical protein
MKIVANRDLFEKAEIPPRPQTLTGAAKMYIFTRILVFMLVFSAPTVFADPKIEGLTGQVTGHVQKVGFRAHILKTAIAYNLT